jgi:hypothetical protein
MERERALGREGDGEGERERRGGGEIFREGLRRRSRSWSIYLFEWIRMRSWKR